jgi:hypothetical protein
MQEMRKENTALLKSEAALKARLSVLVFSLLTSVSKEDL